MQDVGTLGEGSRGDEAPTAAAVTPEPTGEGGEWFKPLFTLPKYDPPSPGTKDGSRAEAHLKVRLARLHIEANEKERSRELEYRLQIKKLEIEAGTTIRLQELEPKNKLWCLKQLLLLCRPHLSLTLHPKLLISASILLWCCTSGRLKCMRISAHLSA